MKPNFLNLFMKKLTRERVVPEEWSILTTTADFRHYRMIVTVAIYKAVWLKGLVERSSSLTE
jgi:hypothetical protein